MRFGKSSSRSCEDLPSDETCIHDSKIEEYLEQMVYDCYEMPKDLPSFISIEIDFDQLKQDYTSFEYFGETYWVRYE